MDLGRRRWLRRGRRARELRRQRDEELEAGADARGHDDGHLLARRRRVHEELRAGAGVRRADDGERRGRLLRSWRVLRGPGEELRDRLLLVAAVRLVHRAQGLGVPAREHVRELG